jgi:hypothetical protein
LLRIDCWYYGDGFNEGIKQGIDRGRLAERIAIARSLLGIIDIEVIAEKPG